MFCPRCDKDEGIKFFEAPQGQVMGVVSMPIL